jgi:hypothetical protein
MPEQLGVACSFVLVHCQTFIFAHSLSARVFTIYIAWGDFRIG